MSTGNGLRLIGDQSVDQFIKAWQRSCLGNSNGWPSESVIAKIVKYLTRLDPSWVHTTDISDGDMMAAIVAQMRRDLPEIYIAFVAYYLHLVNGQRYPKKRLNELSGMIGIAPRTLRKRRVQGYEYAREQLTIVLDTRAAFSV